VDCEVSDNETWKDVVGFEERYEVSDQGRVRNKFTEHILKPAPTSKGYLTVQLYDGSRPKNPRSFCVHDLVLAAFVGPKPAGYQVDHGEKGKQCNALDNLEYVTPAENVRRYYERGGEPKRYYGPDHANAKLTADQVCRLRCLAACGELNITRLATELDVSYSTVSNAASGRTYRNVEDNSLAV
jgi:hypothetical protein